jgi:hypothetical protein
MTNLRTRLEKLEDAFAPKTCVCPPYPMRCSREVDRSPAQLCTPDGPIDPPVCPHHGPVRPTERVISFWQPSDSGPVQVSAFRYCAHGSGDVMPNDFRGKS